MRRIKHKAKAKLNKIAYALKVVAWAMKHQKEVKNYQYLLDMKETMQNDLLIAQRKNDRIQERTLEAQVELLDKIISYVK